jgi:hypothetical protein
MLNITNFRDNFESQIHILFGIILFHQIPFQVANE